MGHSGRPHHLSRAHDLALIVRLLAVCISFGVVVPTASARELPPVGTHISWPEVIDQGQGRVGPVERGILFVPANREKPESGSLALSYWRFKRLGGPKPGQPPIFMLDGGPGFQGYNRYSASWYDDYTRLLLAVADVVYVGQRGIGAAFPSTDCPPPQNTKYTTLDPNYGPAVAQASRACQALWRAANVDIAGLTVPAAAADVDDLRAALGYEQVVLWGESFGTHWSIAVMRQFPGSVARAVLNSIEGPDHTYDEPSGVFRALERIAVDAEGSGAFADQLPRGGFIEALKATIRRAESEPIVVVRNGAKFVITADMLRTIARGYLDAPRGVRREAVWPLGVLKWASGDFDDAAEALDRDYEFGDFWRSASYFQFDCGSGISPERDERLRNDPAMAFIGDPNANYRHACPEWPADSGPDFRGKFSSEIPTLIVHGDWDMSTPWENAVELQDQFERGHLVRVRRGGHGALWDAMEHDPEFSESVMRFLAGEQDAGFLDEVTLPEPAWQLPP